MDSDGLLIMAIMCMSKVVIMVEDGDEGLEEQLTMVVVAPEVLTVDEKVVVLVELPEFAVDDVEVLVAEEVGHLVDVVLILQQPQGGQEPGEGTA